MSSSIYNYFAHTPFNAYVVGQMARELDKAKRNVIAIGQAANYIDTSRWGEVRAYDYLPRSAPGVLSRSAGKERFGEIKDLLLQQKDPVVLLSSIQDPYQNFAYFDEQLRGHCRFEMYFDGLGALLPYHLQGKELWKMRFKNVVGRLGLGAPLTLYAGHQIYGNAESITQFHSIGSKYVDVNPAIRQELKLPKREIVPGDKALYLDQHLAFLKPEDLEAVRAKIAPVLKSLGKDEVLYKTHHFQPEESLTGMDFEGIVRYREKRAVDDIFPTLGVRTVVSFFSTSLVTLKAVYGDDIRCISLLPLLDDYPWYPRHCDPTPEIRAKMKDIFLDYGVEFVS